jgi:anaerobic selenocysteine-containing dehydrogenase
MGRHHHDPARLDWAALGRGAERSTPGLAAVMDDLGSRLDIIRRQHGPDAIAFYFGTGGSLDASGAPTAFRFAAALGSRSIYTTSTLDTVAKRTALRLMTGHSRFFPILDMERAHLVVFFGSNPVVSHGHTCSTPDPVRSLRDVRHAGEVWVFDPRRTETASLADRHVALRPGSDHAVLAFAIRELLRDGADWDFLANHATGVERLRELVEPFCIAVASDRCGIEPCDLEQFVDAIRRHRGIAAISGTGMGFGPSPTVAEWLLLALHVVVGSMERPGGIWFNPGFWTPLEQLTFEPSDGQPAAGPPSRPELSAWVDGQLPAVGLVDEITSGNVRALITVGGNPLISFPDHLRTLAALEELEVLAVTDIVDGDMSVVATHVLPCAGVLERADLNITDMVQPRVFGQYTPPLIELSRERHPLWWYMQELGRRMGLEVLPSPLDSSSTDHDVLKALFPNARVAIDEVALEPGGISAGVQNEAWVTSRVVPNGRWLLAPEQVANQLQDLLKVDPPSGSLLLIPRRQRHHLNSTLRDLPSSPMTDVSGLFLNDADAAAAGVGDGTEVVVRSSHGAARAVVRVDPTMLPGVASMPHGHRDTNVNNLTSNRFDVDELTGMPRFTGIPITLHRSLDGLQPF